MFITGFDVYTSNMVMIYPVVNDVYTVYDDISHYNGDRAMPDKEWQDRVKNLLKAELKRKGISYRQLSESLQALGINETERNIANKISRGGFSATFFVQCLVAAGCTTLHLGDA